MDITGSRAKLDFQGWTDLKNDRIMSRGGKGLELRKGKWERQLELMDL